MALAVRTHRELRRFSRPMTALFYHAGCFFDQITQGPISLNVQYALLLLGAMEDEFVHSMKNLRLEMIARVANISHRPSHSGR
jgi:hypothetical protein